MPRGSSPKREREYEALVEEFKEEGRYKGRQQEVAARIVNKQRKDSGETKKAKKKDKEGQSPDRHLPIDNFDHLTVPQVKSHLKDLKKADIRKIKTYEEKHRGRKTLLQGLERQLGE